MPIDYANLSGKKIRAVAIFDQQLVLSKKKSINYEDIKTATGTPVIETIPFADIISTCLIKKSPFVHIEANNSRGQFRKHELEFTDIAQAKDFNDNLGGQLGYETRVKVDPKAEELKYRVLKVLLIVVCVLGLLYVGVPEESVRGGNGRQELVASFFNKIYENGLSVWVIAGLVIYVLFDGYSIYQGYRRSGKRETFVRPNDHSEVLSYD